MSPSPPPPHAAPPRGNSRSTLLQHLVPLSSRHRTASSSPEPVHRSAGLLLEIDLINAWATSFLGFPLIPSMQIARKHSALHWLTGRPWAAEGSQGHCGAVCHAGRGVLGLAATLQRGWQEWGPCSTWSCVVWLQGGGLFCREGGFTLQRSYRGSGELVGDTGGCCFPGLCCVSKTKGMSLRGAAGREE